MNIDNKMYRVSAKALVRDNDGRVLLVLEKKGVWELPGGGIEHGENAQETVRREVKEECGFDVESVSSVPSYVWTAGPTPKGTWVMILLYQTTLKQMNFIPSDEAVEYRFFSPEEISKLPLDPSIKKLPDLLQKK
ncbi:NUDIX hydrolase [Candidatus Campbellbacteria bacterium]|nr:MAG: NUDIX hydrolase [Candidatus Campbellbacteria bacterium]